MLGTREERGAHDEYDEQECGNGNDPQRESWRDNRTRRDGRHGKPPFGEGPGGPLPRASGLLDDEVSVVRRGRLGDLRQEVRQILVEATFGGHAGCPSRNCAVRGVASRRTALVLAASA